MKRMPQMRQEKMKRAKRAAFQLKKAGVADRERFIRGCLAIVGILFIILLLALLYHTFYGS
jgi:hypothetical protein